MQLCIECSFVMMMQTRLRKFIESCWYGGSTGAYLLLPFAWLYGLLTALRRSLYAAGVFATPELPVPVVIVGNISVGGTGKSPVVAWLAEQLKSAGYNPGIVSRGYGGTHSGRPLLVDSASNAELVGDEPLMLAQLTGCPVCVCVDRVAAVNAVAKQGIDVVIADDGLQHYRLKRTVELVVVDGQRGFGNGRLLPAGPLRENLQRIEEADALLVNGGSARINGIEFKLVAGDLLPVQSNDIEAHEGRALHEFAGQRVWAVAGIGNPERFYAMLSSAGLVVDPVPVEDHGKYPLESLVSRRNQPILMTQKDAVKYNSSAPLNSWYLPVEVEFAATDATNLLQLICARLAKDEQLKP
jgi:tetraacyldisaccharide 4'-kinase